MFAQCKKLTDEALLGLKSFPITLNQRLSNMIVTASSFLGNPNGGAFDTISHLLLEPVERFLDSST